MRVNIERETLTPIDIDKAEKAYNATFIGDFCVKNKDGSWANTPVAVFYQENPPELSKEGRPCSNYFGLYYSTQQKCLMICDAQSAFSGKIVGFIDTDGYFKHSRFRHDYRTSLDGKIFVDGGSDYIRTNCNTLIECFINKDHLEIKEKE